MKQLEASLPHVFAQYTPQVQNIREQVTGKEWSSSCPKCGGDDRCRWFLEGKQVGWCRQCLSLFWPDKAPDWKPPSREEMERWRRERERVEVERKRAAEKALAYLRSTELWRQYHEQLNNHGTRYWERRGIPQAWQDYWSFGWNGDASRWDTPTATIPLFDDERNVLNIKHRLINTNDYSGKYRYEIAGQPQPLFLATASKPAGHTIAVEGEIKAAVLCVTLDDAGMTIVGLPGTNPAAHIIPQFADCERITLVMDPGAQVQAVKLATALGRKRCKVLIPPMKIDDGILATGMTGRDVRALLSQAVGV